MDCEDDNEEFYWLSDQVEKRLEKKLHPFIHSDLIDKQQTPDVFFEKVLLNDWLADGARAVTQDGKQKVTLHFDKLPDSLIELELYKYPNYRNETGSLTITVFWGKFHCSSSHLKGYVPSFFRFRHLVHAFPKIATSLEQQLPGLQAKMKERLNNRAIRQKITEIRKNTIKALLTVECKKLEVPYCIVEMAMRIDLFIRMPDRTSVQLQIPFRDFEDMLPEIPSLIRECVDMNKSRNSKILVHDSRFVPKGSWIEN